MTFLTEIEDRFPTADEADALLAALDRRMEYEAEVAASRNGFEAYWAGSASASVSRDYRAGRVRTIQAGR